MHQHKSIGPCKILIEGESSTDPKRYFALIESINKPVRQKSWETSSPIYYSRMLNLGRKLNPHYYLLWGNTPNLDSMGITHLVTSVRGSQVTHGKAMEIFMEAVTKTDQIKFEQNFHI